MTVARPFCGVRYNTAQVKLSNVLVPPYDVIEADERESFFARDPHNAIRFELTRDPADEADTDYAEVGTTLAKWRASGVLIRDSEPRYYVMRQRFTVTSGTVLERIGFFAELGLENYTEGIVRPHERTLAGPKADRLKLLRASRANLSSVFLLYEDREQALAPVLARALETDTVAEAEDDSGIEYKFALLANSDDIEFVQSFMGRLPVVIADGHHRYETALAYRDERRATATSPNPTANYESTLAYFANAYSPGSLLLPIHRVVKKHACAAPPSEEQWRAGLPSWEHKSVAMSDAKSIGELLAQHLTPLAGKPAFAADDGQGSLRIFWRDEELGDRLMVCELESDVLKSVFGLDLVSILDGAVGFPRSAERAAEEVREGDGSVALYLNPLTPADVFRTTGRREVMPQKSTCFYPKVPTGLVFRDHRK
ncbi:MAG: DUF1015 domain-containing protein [Myxococcales bacterium]|nr:DUF1015 domain-containing protein [Myxococcales bacterium]